MKASSSRGAFTARFKLLTQKVATQALHDCVESSESDPARCHPDTRVAILTDLEERAAGPTTKTETKFTSKKSSTQSTVGEEVSYDHNSGVFCCLKFQGTYILRMPFKQLEKQSAEGAKHFSKRSSIRRVPLAVWKVVCVAWTKASKLGKRKAG